MDSPEAIERRKSPEEPRVVETLTSKTATVTISVRSEVLVSGALYVHSFVINGSSGYRATLPACPCDGTERVPCPLPSGHSAKARGTAPGCDGKSGGRRAKPFCHGWHMGSARRFASEVLATYGAKPPAPKIGGVPRGNPYFRRNALQIIEEPGVPEGRWTVERVADALSLTVEEYRTELAKAVTA